MNQNHTANPQPVFWWSENIPVGGWMQVTQPASTRSVFIAHSSQSSVLNLLLPGSESQLFLGGGQAEMWPDTLPHTH